MKVNALDAKLTFVRQQAEAKSSSRNNVQKGNQHYEDEIKKLESNIRLITGENERLTRDLVRIIKQNEAMNK